MAVSGGTGNDVLIGTTAAEILHGFAGDDSLDGQGGLDSLYGDAGNDTLYYHLGALVSGGAGIDTLLMDFSTKSSAVKLNFAATSSLITGIEVVSGVLSSHNDVLRLDVLRGSDIFSVSVLDGGEGIDTLILDYRGLEAGKVSLLDTLGDDLEISGYNNGYDYGIQLFRNFEKITGYGSGGADRIRLMPETTTLSVTYFGEGGNDIIETRAQNNAIYGGAGNDYIDFYYSVNGTNHIYGGAGNDLLSTDKVQADIFGGPGVDQLNLDLATATEGVKLGLVTGGIYRDFEFYSGTLTDFDDEVKVIWRGASNFPTGFSVSLSSSVGNDMLTLDFGQVTLHGASSISLTNYNGSDAFSVKVLDVTSHVVDTQSYAYFEKVTVWGSAGNDFIEGFDQLIAIHGRGGADSIGGGDLNDHIYGETGNDLLKGYLGDDLLYGGDGDDLIYGGDYGQGTAGNDKIYGGSGNDFCYGGMGNDALNGGTGNDRLFGGSFVAGNDTILGCEGNDLLEGGDGADRLYGGIGNDILRGGVGLDRMDGGDGADVLIGGTDRDIMVGGVGADIFVFDTAALTGVDVIADFQTEDVIYFHGNLKPADISVQQNAHDVVLTWATGSVTLIGAAGATVDMEFGLLYG